MAFGRFTSWQMVRDCTGRTLEQYYLTRNIYPVRQEA